jgi:hypothetical protein
MGEGPLTGRQMGYGAGYDTPGFTKGPGGGSRRRFFNRGAGLSRGNGPRYFNHDWRYDETASHQPDDINQLKSEIEDLKSVLNTLTQQIKSLTIKERKK